MDNKDEQQYTLVVTVHADGGPLAEYEVRASGSIDAIHKATEAYHLLHGNANDVTVCEVRLYNALDAVRKFSATFDRAMGRVAPDTNDDLSDIGEYTLADIAQSRKLVTLAAAYLAQDMESDTSGVDARQCSTYEGDDCKADGVTGAVAFNEDELRAKWEELNRRSNTSIAKNALELVQWALARYGGQAPVVDDSAQDTPTNNTLPGWEWAVEHGFSVEAWRACCRVLEAYFRNSQLFHGDMAISKETGIPYDVVRLVTDLDKERYQ